MGCRLSIIPRREPHQLLQPTLYQEPIVDVVEIKPEPNPLSQSPPLNSRDTFCASVASSACTSLSLTSELQQQQQHITLSIKTLLSSIHGVQLRIKLSENETLTELSAILDALPLSSFQVITTLKRVHTHLGELYDERNILSNILELQSASTHWSAFLALLPTSQIRIAKKLEPKGAPMRMMHALSTLRVAMERQNALDREIERLMAGCFDDVLAELKMRELDGEGTRGCAMQWRLLGIMVGRRVEEGRGRVDEVLDSRMRLSGELLKFLEELAELVVD